MERYMGVFIMGTPEKCDDERYIVLTVSEKRKFKTG